MRCVILVGHGGIPKDCPAPLIGKFKRLEAASKGKFSPALLELDHKIRRWPRTSETDPYKGGLEAVAKALAAELPDCLVLEAYNEFCAPNLEEAFGTALGRGATSFTVVSTMFTRGGVHCETEIPAIIERLRRAHPEADLRYVWPFDLKAVAQMLAREVQRVHDGSDGR